MPKPDLKRRRFLAAAAGAGALGALAAVSKPAVAVDVPLSSAARTSGYHETDHIRHYYRTARYW
ncbi:MAG: formate dehydrogenase [Bdellovibrionales bacterium]|nr:formate dehydrogenase [Massilia sp.]